MRIEVRGAVCSSRFKEKVSVLTVQTDGILCLVTILQIHDSVSPALSQINELSHVQIPIMLMPDDFKAYSKIKVDNHLFNK